MNSSRPMPLMSGRDVCREYVERQYPIPTTRTSVLLYLLVLLACALVLYAYVWSSGPSETQVAADTELSVRDALMAAKAARKEKQ